MIRNFIKQSYLLKQSNKLTSLIGRQSFATTTVAQAKQQVNEMQALENERNASDLRKLAEEQTVQLRSNTSFYFLPWVNDQKPVFEAEIPSYSSFTYSLLAGVLGGAFLYMLYQGDTKYKYFILTPVLALYFGRKGAINQLRNSVPYLHQMSLHKNGQTVDMVISHKGQLSTLNNVAVSQVKLHRADVKDTIATPETLEGFENFGSEVTTSFSAVRAAGAGNTGHLLSVGDGYIIAPYLHNGNTFALNNIWEGKAVDTTQI